jgi:hypothetical protein
VGLTRSIRCQKAGSDRFRRAGMRGLLPPAPACQPAGMHRGAVMIGALLALACVDNPYIIGRVGDGGAAGRASDAGASECGAATLLCSDFEQDLLRDWDDIALERTGMVERSSARAHAGSSALHAVSRGARSAAVVRSSFAPLRSGELGLRVYLYVPAGLPTETMNLLFVGAAADLDTFDGIDINLEDGAVQVFSPQFAPTRHTGSAVIPRDRWFCFRVQIAIDDRAGSVRAYVDEPLAIEALDQDTLPLAGLTTVRAGIDWSSEQAAFFEIYMDDLLVAPGQVACR